MIQAKGTVSNEPKRISVVKTLKYSPVTPSLGPALMKFPHLNHGLPLSIHSNKTHKSDAMLLPRRGDRKTVALSWARVCSIPLLSHQSFCHQDTQVAYTEARGVGTTVTATRAHQVSGEGALRGRPAAAPPAWTRALQLPPSAELAPVSVPNMSPASCGTEPETPSQISPAFLTHRLCGITLCFKLLCFGVIGHWYNNELQEGCHYLVFTLLWLSPRLLPLRGSIASRLSALTLAAFPGGPVAKTLPSQFRVPGFHLWSGTKSHMPQQRSKIRYHSQDLGQQNK